ncbi:hypothetical protein SSX86_019583 [Deinandra increscens subsp. villosa]|uniref:Uncharacterized protein n=1 Tax=Deinandra increscens subsp. villosa TaxID=3103831 RepID=A0AAP0GVV4_9ASTR
MEIVNSKNVNSYRKAEHQARKRKKKSFNNMCPMRVFLVFFSAILAGYLTWKSVTTSMETDDMVSDEDFSASQQESSFIKAAAGKVRKHEKSCLENQHVFVPFAFDTFGYLASEAVDTLSRVQKVMHGNVASPRGMNVVFTRLGFAIQKGLATQLVARLPCTLDGQNCFIWIYRHGEWKVSMEEPSTDDYG